MRNYDYSLLNCVNTVLRVFVILRKIAVKRNEIALKTFGSQLPPKQKILPAEQNRTSSQKQKEEEQKKIGGIMYPLFDTCLIKQSIFIFCLHVKTNSNNSWKQVYTKLRCLNQIIADAEQWRLQMFL